MELLFKWFYDLLLSIQTVWDWFITPINLFGFHIAPIYLISGTMLIAGVLRAIIGAL